ncbi:MAG: choline monooxygenase [Limisphaerales bacterium]|jgi:choline monooxygenase
MYTIDPLISKAATLPSDFYKSDEAWEACKEKVFCNNWQFLADEQEVFKGLENVYPLWLLENYLDEPVILVNQDEQVKCYTNVCTHRGFLLVQHPAKMKKIVCGYHGRRFDLCGKFEAMPEFEEAEGFPRPCDSLSELTLGRWRQFIFTTISPKTDFSVLVKRLEERLHFLPIESFKFEPKYSKTYNVHAHWALYCDNFLEGFHIPFVHQALGSLLDYGSYTTECYDQMVLQIGYSDGTGLTFDLPEKHPDYGKNVAAYYYWLYPNFMLNFYPWGVQLNIVKPVTKDFCKVEFLYYIHDQKAFDILQGDKLAEKTEREDEFVVEAVQRGLRSRFYKAGRFSPKREKGVHYFHSLLSKSLSDSLSD